jgi:Bifunctional DNA primase/polymerase, N-terminal
MSALLETALIYAADGLPVFPLFNPVDGRCSCRRSDCAPAKHPRTLHGLDDATTDATLIREWWRRWPTSNIGLRTGTPGGLVVLDVDSVDAGARLAELAAGRPLGGLIVRTGRGWQLWYRTPERLTIRNSASRLGADLDVRGEGGYVVAPPSLHISGRRYTFDGGRFEQAPPWLLELVAPPAAAAPEPGASAPAGPVATGEPARRFGAAVLAGRCNAVKAAQEGGRNYAVLRAATTCGGYIATGAIDEKEAAAALITAAREVGLAEPEARRTIESGFKRGRAKPLYVRDRTAELLAAARTDEHEEAAHA